MGRVVRSGRSKPDALAIVGVAPANDLVDETAISVQVIEVAAAAQQQCVPQRLLEMPMRTLNRAILVRDTQIVAGRHHVVSAHHRVIAQRQLFLSVALQIPECRRPTIAPSPPRSPPPSPPPVLPT